VIRLAKERKPSGESDIPNRSRSTSQTQAAWITGASRGIGEALAIELASRGWALVLTARDEKRLESVASRCREAGAPDALVMAGDVTDRRRMLAIAEDASRQLGQIDAAVLNAGILDPFDVNSFDSTLFKRHLDVHVMGAVHCIEAVLPAMLERRYGTLLFVASLAGLTGLPKSAPYCAAKGALVNLAESLRIDLRNTGVHVVLANPGFIETDMTEKNEFPMPFMMAVDAAARILADALERNKPEVSFPLPLALATKSLGLMPGQLRRLILSELGNRFVTASPGSKDSDEKLEGGE
jgi:short-subunit dehydrogenase